MVPPFFLQVLLTRFRNRFSPGPHQRWVSSWPTMVAGILSRMTPLPDLFVSSYAAGAVGFGAFFGARCSWSFLPETPSIAFSELIPIVMACHLRGGHWSRLQVHATTQPQCTSLTSSSVPLSLSFVNQWLRSIFTGPRLAVTVSATSAASAGVPDHFIKTLGRWSSNAYQRYYQHTPGCPPQ